jgi:hypothetical protein
MIRIALFFCLLSTAGLSQDLLPIPVNHRMAFAKHTRDNSGLPGAAYWQNSADYLIKIIFDPTTRLLSGKVLITYFNNSPDTLKNIQFKLYPNLYQAGAIRMMPINREDVTDGVNIKSLSIDAKVVQPKSMVIRGTNMNIRDCIILPGTTATVSIDYSYTLNQNSFIRTGQIDDGSYFIAYFFPRIAVYDDIDGWDTYPYTGREEFYNDYGNFTCEITIPNHYMVWSTGDLVNAKEVLTDKILERLDSAVHQNAVVNIVSESDLNTKNILHNQKQNTWIFKANDISDMAFAVSDHFIWKSTSVVVDSATQRRTRVDVVYNPSHQKFGNVVGYAQRTLGFMSHRFPKYPFPYSHMTVVEGLDAMEYPMMVNCIPFEDDAQAVELTAHEIFHTLFPFYVGLNETKNSFIDEGLATLSEFTLHPWIAPSIPMNYDISPVNETAGADYDVPVVTLTPQLTGKARYANKDLKPALGFHYVKEMIGEKKFSNALRFFISTWRGKHPQPYDFFNCMNKGSGINLNWFWNDWFYNKIAPDLAITKVSKEGRYDLIEIHKAGPGMVPIHLSIGYADGSNESRSLDISCWSKGNNFVSIKGQKNKSIVRIELGDEFDADIDKSNNSWQKQ